MNLIVPFIFELRKRKVPVGAQEAIALSEAMEKGIHNNSIDGFYFVARSLLIHSEGHLDSFDEAFNSYFRGIEIRSNSVKEELLEWLKNAKKDPRTLTAEEKAFLDSIDMDELRKMLEERMDEQDEQHDGGDKWIGTAGASPFGQKAKAKKGIRVGGEGGQRSARQVADARLYRGYRSDLTLDTRQISMALKRLRAYIREGGEEELDLDETIDKTARNAGELEVVVRPPNRPNTKVILMMDIGGSMDPYIQLVSRLFSATKKSVHFKELRCYYFHNCVYGRVYETERMIDPIYIKDLIHEYNPDYKLIMVGDALMAPDELMSTGSSFSTNDHTQLPGLGWLMMMSKHFRKSVWLNPEPPNAWKNSTIEKIGQAFEMFPLTLDGLSRSMQHLVKGQSVRR